MTTGGSYDELEMRCREISGLLRHGDAYSPSFLAWRKDVERLLQALFGTDSEPLERFRSIYYTPFFFPAESTWMCSRRLSGTAWGRPGDFSKNSLTGDRPIGHKKSMTAS